MKWTVLIVGIITIGILGYTVYMQSQELAYYDHLNVAQETLPAPVAPATADAAADDAAAPAADATEPEETAE